jgi:hypothetical protein
MQQNRTNMLIYAYYHAEAIKIAEILFWERTWNTEN